MRLLCHVKQRIWAGIFIFFAVHISFVWADVFEWKDLVGRFHFSDRPHADSKKLELNPGYSYQRIVQVFDGDTVKLENGQKVRLLGINTPEIKHRNQSAQVGGDVAKNWLTQKLLNQKVRLVTDSERTDKYQRTLAHVFTENKEHINLQLVEAGLAAVNIYPPNLLYVDELVAASNRAELAKRGIWGTHEYDALPVNEIGANGHDGWLRLTGKITIIRSSRKYVYLEFIPLLQARIEKSALALFPPLETYQGKQIEIRGWLNKNRGGWSMLIRHPSAIKVQLE